MIFKVGDLVTRKSYNNDTLFEITNITRDLCYLRGVNLRLVADAFEEDLTPVKSEEEIIDDEELSKNISDLLKLDRSEYFYIPGKILHIDADSKYLDRCLNFYRNASIVAYGINESEESAPENISKHLESIRPDILIITGHDAHYKKTNNKTDSYKNSENFIRAIQEARKYEKAHDKLIIIAGACQSNYEELIKAGANFASSPKRINIHALDPAIIATSVSLSDRSEDIDLKGILGKTKYGSNGLGGIKTKGTMYVGFPR